MTNDVLARYQQAQSLEQGALSKLVVLNDTVFPHWIGNSDCFWYARETDDGKAWRLVDANAVSNEIAFDHAAFAGALESAAGQPVDPANLPICVEEISLSPRHIRFQAFDKSWVFEVETRTCKPVVATDAGTKTVESAPDKYLLSPNGNLAAFVRDHNLWVHNITSGEEYVLTKDGCADNAYGTAAAAFGAICTSAVQAKWSPDSRYLLTHQLDVRQVAIRAIVRHVPQDGTIRPQLSEYKAAYPGDKTVESYRLFAIDTNTGEQQAANYAPLRLCKFGNGFFSEEKFGWWANDNRRAYFIDVTRGGQTVHVVEFDTQTGATRVLFEETSDTAVKLSHTIGLDEPPLVVPLPDTEELIWFSERTGWGHLYLYDLNTGKLKHSITGGPSNHDNKEWLIRNILHLDTKRRELLVQTAARDSSINPYYRDICRVHLDTGVIKPLATGPFEHVVFNSSSYPARFRSIFGLDTFEVNGVSPSGNYLVTTRSRVDMVPVSLLIDRDGNEVLTLETADPFGLPVDWHWPEPVKLMAADAQTELYGVVYRPPGFSPDKSYPVLDFCCADPGFSSLQHSSFTSGSLSGLPYFRAAAYAALGFVVVTLEGPGTPYRQKTFQDVGFGDMIEANAFKDRIAGLRQLAERYPCMDLERVGIVAPDGLTGPVYGLLKHPTFYKVGVMVAFQDTRFTPACLVETLRGTHPQAKTPYAEALVESLQGKLLLIHGMLDTTAAPAGFFRLINALQNANKDFDMLLLPNLGHDLPSYVLRRSWDYLVTNLQGVEPPKAFKLTKGLDLLTQDS